MQNEDKNLKNFEDFKFWKQLYHYFSDSLMISTDSI
jgi:hypothetical protein